MTGRAPAAKRKTSAELAEIRALIAEAVPSEKWLPILQRLAQSDNPRVIELLLKYRFGLPPGKAPFEKPGMHSRADVAGLVRICLPAVDGDHGVESASGAAMDVSPKPRGRAAVRRGGGRGKK